MKRRLARSWRITKCVEVDTQMKEMTVHVMLEDDNTTKLTLTKHSILLAWTTAIASMTGDGRDGMAIAHQGRVIDNFELAFEHGISTSDCLEVVYHDKAPYQSLLKQVARSRSNRDEPWIH